MHKENIITLPFMRPWNKDILKLSVSLLELVLEKI